MKQQLAAILLVVIAFAASSQAQAPTAPGQQDQQILAVVRELQTQQLAIADNQAKIEAKLATVTEALRLARIYSSRGGQNEKQP
ncbi:MAG TPA: hypothetical protein VK993_06505 [Chthoniobacterales bacterium]|nr:hypothetical protein [Chthoniobacterales bacterium]